MGAVAHAIALVLLVVLAPGVASAVRPSHSRSGGGDDVATYRAASIVYTPSGSKAWPPEDYLDFNLGRIATHVVNASAAGAQIVVLPETVFWEAGLQNARDAPDSGSAHAAMRQYGLTLPDPELVEANPCVGGADPNAVNGAFLAALSCLAREEHIVLVANVIEAAGSDTQPLRQGGKNFNAIVVFDHQGTIIGKYRKHHVFGTSYAIDQPPPMGHIAKPFSTHFGVQFGAIVCFDMEAFEPANTWLSSGVENFVFSSAWVNSFPVIYATQVQLGFAISTQSNLIASNIGGPVDRSGSGIYTKGTVLAEDRPGQSNEEEAKTGKVLIADVPKHPQRPWHGMVGMMGPDKELRVPPPLWLADSLSPPVTPSRAGPRPEPWDPSAATPCDVSIGGSMVGTAACLPFENMEHEEDTNSLYANVSFGDITCEFSLEGALNIDYGSNPVVAVFSSPVKFPYTPSHLTIQFCIALPCKTFPDCRPENSGPDDSRNFNDTVGTFTSVSVKATTKSPTSRTVPILGSYEGGGLAALPAKFEHYHNRLLDEFVYIMDHDTTGLGAIAVYNAGIYSTTFEVESESL